MQNSTSKIAHRWFFEFNSNFLRRKERLQWTSIVVDTIDFYKLKFFFYVISKINNAYKEIIHKKNPTNFTKT